MSSLSRSRNNTFSSLEIERDADWRSDTAVINRRLHGDAVRFLLLRSDGRALIGTDGHSLRGLQHDDFVRFGGTENAVSYLGQARDQDWFVWRAEDAVCADIAAQAGGEFLDLRAVGMLLQAFDAGLFAYARALAHWQERTRYCSVCASPLRLESAGHRAKCTNPHCGSEHFPRTDPAMIVVVSCGDACLLGRQASWPKGRYSALAGFIEPGETLEAAVQREVHEEAGVRVVDCDYHSSQPWPFPASIMLGFLARADDPTIKLGPELEDARWFTAQQIIDGLASGELLMPSPLSVSYRLVEHWLREAAGVELDTLTLDDPMRKPRSR
ncbi:MAG: NAD(+) diphosphatase [Rudaea sp.]|uniref:NAD(+) diphosphatase n=1 Tax=unclassified Rudaea TaxID=2627037 RepID=UPI0010F7B468|nr:MULTISPECIES: NAD(+) diphosphatase [unclassified Rudaea]MBN8886063.1 NAD(+) diphosphatase [Rudaea sp.]MBR0345966.1 NAD(+) diphosphatase [Rudaea sp.]